MKSDNQQGLIKWINDIKPDIIVVYSMSQLLKENIFSIPKHGTINLHPSILPKYRGPNPIFWQYYNMETNRGVTVHYIDQGEDTGDIIFQESSDYPIGTKLPLILDNLIGKIGVRLVLKALDAIHSGKAPRIRQPATSPTKRARNLTPDEYKTIIDWKNWPVERIWNILRGTEQWLNTLPQPKNILKMGRWVIENYEKKLMQVTMPGKITKLNSGYYLACKDGQIKLSIKFSVKNLVLNFLKS